MDFVVINRRNLMAMSVSVGPTPSLPPYQKQPRDGQAGGAGEGGGGGAAANVTANSLEHEHEEDYYNDTMFTAIRGGINNNLFQLTRDKDGSNGRKAAKTTVTTTTKTTTTTTLGGTMKTASAGARGKARYFEVPDLINRNIDEANERRALEQEVQEEEERQALEEATLDAIEDDDDADDDDVDDDDGDDDGIEDDVGDVDEEGGAIIMPEDFEPRATTNTRLGAENWQKLGTLDKANTKTTRMPTSSSSSSSSTTTTTTTERTTTRTTPTPTTRATAATAASTAAAAPSSPTQQQQQQHPKGSRKHHQHHNNSNNKHHHKQRQQQQQQQQPRRHHVASHEQAMLEHQEETTTRDSSIHRVRTEMLPENIIPSTPGSSSSSNSKIIAIKPKTQKRRISKRAAAAKSGVEIEPEYLLSSSEFVAKSSAEQQQEEEEDELDLDLEDGDFQAVQAVTPATPAVATPGTEFVRLDGFAGMLQLFFGIDKPIDVTIFAQPPSAEFVNLLCALLVWSVRYPAVFWNTSKSFACVFSLQMIVAALDIVLGYVGVSNLYKLQIYAEAMPVHQPGLILNATVTLALYLLATALVLASSMVMYLYGHGRLATRMRDRSIITLKASQTWIYFAHCASLCFVLALAVVKAPLLNDLSATYKNNLHCPTFLAGE